MTWLFTYQKEWLRFDLVAGLTTVAVVAVAISIAASSFAGLDEAGISLVGTVQAGLPSLWQDW